MTLDLALRYLTWAVYLAVFLLALRRALRTPTPSHQDIALFFGAFALLIVLVYIQGVVGRLPARPLTLATGTLAMLLPYLLLRVVTGFAQTPRWLVHVAEAGLILSIAGLAFSPDPTPLWIVVLFVAYFVGLMGYDTYAFVREATQSAGVTHRRVQAAAVGSFALASAVLFAVVTSFTPGTFDIWNVLTRLMGITSAVAYYIGFAPPRWLRQAWQAPALQAFLSDITHLPYMAELQTVLAELERHAAAVVGAPSAAIGLWQESEGVLRFWSGLGGRRTLEYPGDLARWGIVTHHEVIDIPPNRILSGRAFVEQHSFLSTDVPRDDPDNRELYLVSGVRAVLAAPISAGEQRLGVLTVWSPRPPVFAESDLELVELVARQAAAVLESRTLLQQVAEARARAEADRLKDSFLASLSHDLRNPLTAVGATAQLLRRRLDRAGSIDPERLRASVASIETSASQMASLVDQLLDYARLQLDRPLDLNRQPTDLVELTRRVVALHEGATERHNVQLDASEPTLVGMWDHGRLERVLQNLVSNAIKYSPDGGDVRVRIWREQGSKVDWAVVAIQDHGLGIPAADLPQIFDRFHRASNVRDQISGTGIGLATARSVVEQHGGTILVESEEHQGSTFTIRLPLGGDDQRPPDDGAPGPATQTEANSRSPGVAPGFAWQGGVA